MQIALVQMKVADGEPLANLEHAEALIRAHPGADLYLLPEVWPTGYDRGSWQGYVDEQHAVVMKRLSALSQELGIAIGGSYITQNEAKQMVNRFLLLSPEQAQVISYDKAHLFSMLQEDQYLTAGTRRVSTQLGQWQVGLSICFDLRFPNMYREEALAGVTLFLVVAQWPEERCHHMVALARARAIENQSYVALCNRIGASKNGLTFGGESGIWGPDGEQLCQANQKECVVIAKLDLEVVQKQRAERPFLQAGIKGIDT